MGKTAKILTGVGIAAGITYLGRRKMQAEDLAARGGGFLGYLKGLGQGFFMGVKQTLRFG